MKRFLLVALVLIGSGAFAQNYNFLNGPTGGGAEKIITVGSGRLLAYKGGAGIYSSDDAGATWVKTNTGMSYPYLTDLFMDSSGKIYALMASSLYVSSDNGVTWSLLANTGFDNAARIAQGPSGNLFIASTTGKIYRSINGGTSWFERIQFYNSYVNVYDLEFTSGGKMLIGSYYGLFTTTAETDLSATAATGLSNNVIRSIVQNGSNIYVLTGAGPAKSTNGGTSFTAMTNSPVPSCCFYNDLMEKDPAGVLYLTNGGTLYKSTDGSTWSASTIAGPVPGVSATYNALSFTSASTFYLSIQGVGIYKTTNTGTSWTAVNNGYLANDLYDIMITDNGRLLVSKSNGFGIHMSTDDGASWDFLSSGNLGRSIKNFIKIGSTIYAFGSGILKSTDNAGTWSLVHNGTSTSFLFNFMMPLTKDGTTIYSFDNYDYATPGLPYTFGLWKSTNGGTTFARSAISGLPASNVATFTSDRAAAIDSNGNIYILIYTYANGTNTLYKIPNGSTTATQITNSGITSFYDLKTYGAKLYVTGDGGKLAVTSDAGSTWTMKTITSGYNRIEIVNDNTYYAFSSSIALSTDGGANWTNTGSVSSTANVLDIAVSSTNYSYVIANYAGAYKSKSSIIPPAAPTSLTLLANGHNAVALEWTDNSTTETYFRIEASKGDNTHYDSVAFATRDDYFTRQQAFSYAYSLTPGTKYFFRVKAVGPGGFSAATNEISVTLPADCTGQSTIPTNRSWTASSKNLSGTNVSPVLNLAVVKATNAPGDLYLPNIALGVGNTLSPTPEDPIGAEIVDNCGAVFLLQDDFGGGQWIPNGQATWNSATGEITIPIKSHPIFPARSETIVYKLNSSDPAPGAPTNLTGGVYTTGKTLFGWAAPDFVTKFEIERSPNNNTSYTKIGEVNATTLSYKDLDASLVVGAAYFYRVRAVNASGASPYSNEISITPGNQYNFDPFVNLPSKMFFTSSSGGAWGDLDGDGIDDLVIGSAADSLNKNLPPIAFKGYGTGKFTRMAIPELADEATGDYRNISIVDVNNDGRNDMYFTRLSNQDFLMIRNSNNSWTKAYMPKKPTGGIANSAWADIDNDGDLDLMVGLDVTGAADVKIYKNDGNGNLAEFTDSDIVTSTVGSTRDIQFADYDNDGLVDVLKLNRQTGTTARSVLYKNAGGGNFKPVVGSVFETLRAAHRTASWGDYDNDGDLDVFLGVTSLSAGNTNRLIKNNGNGTFSEVTGSAMTEAIITYGSAWADIDNDTDLDLMISTSTSNKIYFNNGDGTFTKSLKDELFTNPNIGKLYGLSVTDVDNDGFVDFYIGGFSGQDIPNFIFRNQSTPSGSKNYLKIKLQGATSNRSAVGARLKIVANGKTLTRHVQSHTSFSTQSSLIQHFGLGGATTVSSLTIYWPSGTTQTLGPINTVNQTITVIEGQDLDVTRPVITFSPSSLNTLQKGFAPTDFNITVTDDNAVKSSTFFHRKISESEFQSSSMGISPTTFSVNNAMTDDMGMEYYFEATDVIGKSRLPATEGTYFRSNIQYSGSNQPIIKVPGEGNANSWKIISIPYDISTTQINSIFSDLGEPGGKTWRLLRYNGQSPVWLEYPNGISTIERGKGYFINATKADTITLSDPKSPAYSRDNLFKMNLAAGWNQIGNPYAVTINWNGVRTFNNIGDKVKELYLFAAGSYTQNEELLKETGGFVFATEAVNDVAISFAGQTPAAPSRIRAPHFGPIDSESWLVNLTASSGEASSPIGGVGMTPESSDSYDELDQFSPPRFINYVEFNFSHPEYFYPWFGRDVVKTAEEYVWQFDVETNQAGLTTLSWNKPSVGDNDVQLYLFDVARQKPVDMIAETSYTIDPSKGKTFKVYYGRDILAKIRPNKLTLGAAFPNPTNSSTTISFTIPETSGKVHARLEVFDLTGRKVSTLANGEFEAGFYSADWHPADGTPNGLYVYRLSAGGEVLGGKMILKK